MTSTILFIPCIKFLVNLVLVSATLVVALWILMFGYNIVMSMLILFLYGDSYEDEATDDEKR